MMQFESSGKVTLHHHIGQNFNEQSVETILTEQDSYLNNERIQSTDSNIEFVKGSFNEYAVWLEFDDSVLRNLDVTTAMFHTTDDFNIYSFSTEQDLMNVYLSNVNHLLYSTNSFKIGTDKVDNVKLELTVETELKQNIGSPKSFLLGFIPYEWEDEED